MEDGAIPQGVEVFRGAGAQELRKQRDLACSIDDRVDRISAESLVSDEQPVG